jgi:hypothetical protein
MTDRELMQQALDALEEYCEQGVLLRPIERREALRARLAQPERAWQGLTDEEREEATGWSVEHIEAKLKEKNGF